jgi:hypothetical protein
VCRRQCRKQKTGSGKSQAKVDGPAVQNELLSPSVTFSKKDMGIFITAPSKKDFFA